MDSAALECRTLPIYFRHHHLEVRRQVEELFTVTPPIGVLPPGGRNLPKASRMREGGYVHFVPTRFVRRVSDPAPIRMEQCFARSGLTRGQHEGRPISEKGQDTYVTLGRFGWIALLE